MAESSHVAIKEITNRHTPISVAFDKICIYIEMLQRELEAEANAQRIHLPQIMDRDMFAVVGSLVTHETILLISFELNEAKRWVENVTDVISSPDPPPGEGCIFDCEAPIRYGLPCKCWLFPCVQLNIPILISLIHPCWFFDGPSKVVSWNMSFDLELDFAQMMYQS